MMRVLSTLLISSGVVYSDKVPSQIHLALGPTPDSMGVQWSSDSADSTVKYRKANSENDWSLVHGKTFPFMDGGEEKYNQTHHVARMVELEPSTPYEYKVGSSADGWSEKFTFSATPTTDSAKYPIRFGVWGDMGSKDNGAAILNEVTDVVDNGNSFDMILHVGDFAYNMDNNNGKLGDDFMNDIQHIATQIPYMVCVGNHEVAYDFSHYTERFRVVGDSFAPASYPTVHSGNGEGFNNWFYSHDFANVHFVAISTEIYFDYADTDLLAAQWNFVKDDLEKVDRKKTPWVVVHGHRPCYCSCDDDCDDAAALVRDGVEGQFGLEALLHKYKVDLFLAGHEHNYERMYDVYKNETTQTTTNPAHTIHIITGDAGGPEGHETFTRPQPDLTAFRTDGFGYSQMTVYNDTHLLWEQRQGEFYSDRSFANAKVIDSFWLVQENH